MGPAQGEDDQDPEDSKPKFTFSNKDLSDRLAGMEIKLDLTDPNPLADIPEIAKAMAEQVTDDLKRSKFTSSGMVGNLRVMGVGTSVPPVQFFDGYGNEVGVMTAEDKRKIEISKAFTEEAAKLSASTGISMESAMHSLEQAAKSTSVAAQGLTCSAVGHQMESQTVTYADGQIVGYCQVCGDRMKVNWVRGGTSSMRAKAFAQQLMRGVDGPRVGDLVQALADVEEDLKAIEEARDLARLALQKEGVIDDQGHEGRQEA